MDNSNILRNIITENNSEVIDNSVSSDMNIKDQLSDLIESQDCKSSLERQEETIKENHSIPKEDIKSEDKDNNTDDEWLDIMGSGNFKKKVIKPGLGHETRPNKGDQVTITASFYVNELLFDQKTNIKIIVGDLDVIQGLDLAVCLMEKGETARLKIPSKLAYGTVGLLPDVPPDTDIECEIELQDVEQFEEQSLSVSDRLRLGDEKRMRGNFFYDRGQCIDAIHCYERAAEYLEGLRDSPDNSPSELQEIINLRLKVYNNSAAAHLKLSSYSSALKSVEAVLKIQPKNVKALFRKGKILGLQGSTDEAINCMRNAARLEPETKVILSELAKLINQKKREEHSQRVMYQRMFKNEKQLGTNRPPSTAVSWFKKWSMISCGVAAVAIGSAVFYQRYHL